VREIRLLRAMWRELETELRNFLNGHEGGNAGYGQGNSYGFTRQLSTLPGRCRRMCETEPRQRLRLLLINHISNQVNLTRLVKKKRFDDFTRTVALKMALNTWCLQIDRQSAQNGETYKEGVVLGKHNVDGTG